MTASSLASPAQAAGRAGLSAADLAFTSYLRVAAMCAVVLIHAMSAIVGNHDIRGSTTWWLATAIDLGSSWSVPIFIMVSGALLLDPHHHESPRTFYARRLHRIAIPLVVAHVGYLAVRAFWQGEQLTVTTVVVSLLRANVYPHLYFFWIVLGLYLLTPLLRPLIAAFGRRELVVIGVGIIGWMWSVQAASQVLNMIGARTVIWQPAALTLFIPYVGYFILGMALRDVVLKRWNLWLAIGLFVVADAIVILTYGAGGGTGFSVLFGGGYQGIPVAVTTIVLFLVARTLMGPQSWLAQPARAETSRYLGSLTLGVFMVHPAILRLGWGTPTFNFSLVDSSLPLDLALWLLTTVTSFAACALIGRIPVLRRTIGL
jgi:surface polysaccharide O-acyltransferase-like enzyme